MSRWDGLTYEDRFWRKVEKQSGDGCWLWQASLNRSGYGQFFYHGRMVKAHRLAYALLIGEVPDETVMDHLCHTMDLDCPGGTTCLHRRCVNPFHLEPVAPVENTRRGGARRTHCLRGHPFDAANTLLYRGRRTCRACNQVRFLEWQSRHSEAS